MTHDAQDDPAVALACFYLWVEEWATVFCPICVTDAEMGEDCLCGEAA